MSKVLLLGSSVELFNNPRGEFIDSFDTIWRTNHTGHPLSIEKHPKIVGSKHGNWYCHDLSFGIFNMTENLIQSKYSLDIVNRYDKIIQNTYDTEAKSLKTFNKNIKLKPGNSVNLYKNHPNLVEEQLNDPININKAFNTDYSNIYFPYLNIVKDCYKSLKEYDLKLNPPPQQKPSSGLRTLIYLLKQYDHIHLMGFDGGSTGHWYTKVNLNLKYHKNSDKITTKHNRRGTGKHYLDLEYNFFRKLEKENKITLL